MSRKSDRKSIALPMPDPWDGSAEGKTRLHKEVQFVFREVARILGFGKSEYEIGSNVMGPAAGGEVHFYSDSFHLWMNFGYSHEWGPSLDVARDEGWMTARRVAHRRDYTGAGPNVDLAWELLWDPSKLVEVLRVEGVVGMVAEVAGNVGTLGEGEENVHDCI